MKLVNFSVTNFRSITTARRVAVSETTILIGRNNEGKSNLLKALAVAMRALQDHARYQRRPTYRRSPLQGSEEEYTWERDFPIALQSRSGQKQSIFRLEFELNDSDVADFHKEIGSTLNGSLPLELRIGQENRPSIRVSKQGPGSKTLNARSAKIAVFIASRIYFNYIPAVRTDQEALGVIAEMVSRELSTLENDAHYLEALKTIAELQKPLLDNLARRIKDPLSEFLPNIKDVRIEISEGTRRFAQRRDFQVIIDDGTPTNIEFKGDGVKSLATLGLLKNRLSDAPASIIAIEEPESHLHPEAIHQLNDIIGSLASENEILISSHNPLFVDRETVRSNVIIDSGKATPAKNIQQIREILGVKASDNLVNASYALVVEGTEDEVALRALLASLSARVAKWLKSHLLVIEPIGGAGNLPYKLSLIKNALCIYHVLLDNDEAGKDAFHRAEADGLLSSRNCTFVMCPGMGSSEFEDCIHPDVYRESILQEHGVRLDGGAFRGNKKWSDRLRDTFRQDGKLWDDSVESRVKNTVAQCVVRAPKNALNEHKRSSIDALVTSLEHMVKS